MTGETQRAIALGPQKAIQARVLALSETIELTAVSKAYALPERLRSLIFIKFDTMAKTGYVTVGGRIEKVAQWMCSSSDARRTYAGQKLRHPDQHQQIANPEPTLGLKDTPSKSAIASHVHGDLGTMCMRSVRVRGHVVSKLQARPNLVIVGMTDPIG